MTRTLRVLEVLRMFSDGVTSLSALEITTRLGAARATAYRCIADRVRRSGLRIEGRLARGRPID